MSEQRFDSLHRLAGLHGVLVRYRDGFGQQRIASPETLLAVLRQLGAPLEAAGDAEAAIAARRQATWRQWVEPVTVCWEGASAACRLRLPAEHADATLSCELQLEGGEARRWQCDLSRIHAQRGVDLAEKKYYSKKLAIPWTLPWGYHRLRLEANGATAETLLLAAPEQCHPLHAGEQERRWGVFLPLYALHSEASWGAGDFSDLAELFRWSEELGAGIVGTLPLLAAFLDVPCDPSPYTPASRQFWNEFYVNLRGAPEFERSQAAKELAGSAGFQAEIEILRAAKLVDYERQMALKRRVIEEMAKTLLSDPSQRRGEFWRYVDEHPTLNTYACFRAVGERLQQVWTQWPQRLREGQINEGDFDLADRTYHLYAQWLAEQQVQALAEKSRGRGLYLDLPLGVHPGGFDVWQEPASFAQTMNGGAPPDRFFTKGQDWGFSPLHPERIREIGYRNFIACVRHHLRHAGILRIDHVMGLHRLYWVPQGFEASQGAYVSYRAEEFYAILNIESRRHQAAIVGEDLGTVPGRVRAAMDRHGYAGMYVAQFELDPDPARAIHPTPATSLASLNTHDMRPFAGVWQGLDIADQLDLGLLGEHQAAQDRGWKEASQRAVLEFLRQRGWLDAEQSDLAAILRACLFEVASRDVGVMLINLEDLWLETESQNTPGTVAERPNWRRKARYSLETIRLLPEVGEVLRRVHELRSGQR